MSSEGEVPDIPMGEDDPVGEGDKYSLQTGYRVKVPKEYVDHLDIEVGDDVLVACKEDRIVVMKWSLENTSKVTDEL